MDYSYYGGWHEPNLKPKRGLQYMAIDYHLEKIIKELKEDYDSLKESMYKQYEKELKSLETRYGDEIKKAKKRIAQCEDQLHIIHKKLPDISKNIDSMKDGIGMLIEICGNSSKLIEEELAKV